jgi:hypothetical protein
MVDKEKIIYQGTISPHFFTDKNGDNYLVPSWKKVPSEVNISNWEEYIIWDKSSFTREIVGNFESSSAKGIFYEVIKSGTMYTCTCPGFKMAKSGKCKHIKSILE